MHKSCILKKNFTTIAKLFFAERSLFRRELKITFPQNIVFQFRMTVRLTKALGFQEGEQLVFTPRVALWLIAWENGFVDSLGIRAWNCIRESC